MTFETLKQIADKNRAEIDVDDYYVNEGECPYCAWPLDTNSCGVTSCPICERIFK